MVAINLNVIVCPYKILFHMIITELLAIRQPFWIPKWSLLFKLYKCKTDLCEYTWTNIHCYKTYYRLFALYKVESIITEGFSELLRVHGGHLE